MNNIISVIVPIYNVEKYIEKCIDSIINQTYKYLQIILVDDGSTDNSGTICDIMAEKDARIVVLHKENGGLVSARKAGLEIANGQYIGFVDGDDYIEPNMYEELLDELLLNKADFIHTGYFRHNGSYVEQIVDFESQSVDLDNFRYIFLEKSVLGSEEHFSVSPSIWTKLFKAELVRECYQQVNDSQSYGEDLLCLCACALKAHKVVLKKKAYYHYLVRENSITNTKDETYLTREIGLYENLRGLFSNMKLNNKLFDKFLVRHVVMGLSVWGQTKGYIIKYAVKDIDKFFGKKIILYGAGAVGQDYYMQFRRYARCDLVAWSDKDYERYHYDYFDIISLDKALQKDFDFIVLAIKNEESVKSVVKKLKIMGVVEEKIYWQKCEFAWEMEEVDENV